MQLSNIVYAIELVRPNTQMYLADPQGKCLCPLWLIFVEHSMLFTRGAWSWQLTYQYWYLKLVDLCTHAPNAIHSTYLETAADLHTYIPYVKCIAPKINLLSYELVTWSRFLGDLKG